MTNKRKNLLRSDLVGSERYIPDKMVRVWGMGDMGENSQKVVYQRWDSATIR